MTHQDNIHEAGGVFRVFQVFHMIQQLFSENLFVLVVEFIVFWLVAMRPIFPYANPMLYKCLKTRIVVLVLYGGSGLAFFWWYWVFITWLVAVCAIHLILSAHSYCDQHQCNTASLPRLLHSVHISANLWWLWWLWWLCSLCCQCEVGAHSLWGAHAYLIIALPLGVALTWLSITDVNATTARSPYFLRSHLTELSFFFT